MIEDTAKIVNEALKDKLQINLIINNRAGGNAPLIAQKIADRLHSEKQERLFWQSHPGRMVASGDRGVGKERRGPG
jgi:hypothetical protein